MKKHLIRERLKNFRKNEAITLYLKLTRRCNLNCRFCYVEKSDLDRDVVEKISPRELARLLYEQVIKEIEKRGRKIHLVLHGGEFTLYTYEKLSEFLFSLRKLTKGSIIQVSGMSNLSSNEIEKNLSSFLSVVGISTSFNKYVINQRWFKNSLKILELQKRLHFNQVFDYSFLKTKSFLSTYEKLVEIFKPKESESIVIKFERYLDPNNQLTKAIENEYELSSIRLIEVFEMIRKDYAQHQSFFSLTFPFLLLALSIRLEIPLEMGGFFCSSFCDQNLLVINSDLSISTCTKKYESTRLISSILSNSAEKIVEKLFLYWNDLDKNYRSKTKICRDCFLYRNRYCFGGCRFREASDSKNECSNSRAAIQYLLDLKEKDFFDLVKSNDFFRQILRSVTE